MYLSCKTNICPLRNDWLDEQSLCKIRENLFWHYVKKLCYHPLLWLATNAMIITFSHFSSWYVERLPSLFSQLILSNIIISSKKKIVETMFLAFNKWCFLRLSCFSWETFLHQWQILSILTSFKNKYTTTWEAQYNVFELKYYYYTLQDIQASKINKINNRQI